jgi:hypothetical protein
LTFVGHVARDAPTSPQHPEAFPRWHSKGRRHSPRPVAWSGPGIVFCGKTNPALDLGAAAGQRGLRDRPTTLRMRVFQYPLQMELSQPARGPIIASIEQVPPQARSPSRKRSMSLRHTSQCCHGIRYPLHLAACPRPSSAGIGGAVEPLATGLPRLGALSVIKPRLRLPPTPPKFPSPLRASRRCGQIGPRSAVFAVATPRNVR